MLLGIIPARFASTRFPGKPLADIGGKTMVQRVYEQASLARRLDAVVVATDDGRIFEHVRSFGGEVRMTRPGHPSGTDRCAEVARLFPGADYVLNIQGDEPFIHPEQIDLLADTLTKPRGFHIATLAKKITSPESLFNPNVVKTVFNERAGALYFSRHPIPFLRGTAPGNWLENGQAAFFKHIGLYGFRRRTLMKIARLQPSPLEWAESLEQLRWLENGFRIGVGITDMEVVGIDTPEDLERARAALV